MLAWNNHNYSFILLRNSSKHSFVRDRYFKPFLETHLLFFHLLNTSMLYKPPVWHQRWELRHCWRPYAHEKCDWFWWYRLVRLSKSSFNSQVLRNLLHLSEEWVQWHSLLIRSYLQRRLRSHYNSHLSSNSSNSSLLGGKTARTCHNLLCALYSNFQPGIMSNLASIDHREHD